MSKHYGSDFQGGSWVSTGDLSSRFARYAFRRHFFQHAGFRIARNIEQIEKIKSPIRLVSNQVYMQGIGYIGTVNTFLSYKILCDQLFHDMRNCLKVRNL